MALGIVTEFIGKTSVRVYAEIQDDDDEFVDPSTSVTVDIWKPDTTKAADNQAMTKLDTGKYHYIYTLAASPDIGRYRGVVWATDGSTVSEGSFSFKVKE
jgi:hypothetical protein